MLEKIKSYRIFLPEIIIFSFAIFSRFFRLDFPKRHMFDEVYHAFTAQRIFYQDPKAWEWWNVSPPGFAFEWSHPPLAKEFMAFAILIFGDTSFAWRFFSAFFGSLSVVLIYLITFKLFKNRIAALVASLTAALDGLLLVMGRIAMNDSYFVFFSLLSVLFYLNNRKFLMALSLGLAMSSKWSGVFVILTILIFELYKFFKKKYEISKPFFTNTLFLLIIPFAIYLLSYLPFFLGKHTPPSTNFNNIESFIELQRQMYLYHTNLTAIHPYQSRPIDWIFNLRPVWLFVEYKDNLISSIYTLGNSLFAWGGLLSVFILIFQFFKKQSFNLFIILVSYFLFFVPWAFSPRIMFNYHYLLSSSFLAIAQGVVISQFIKNKNGKILSLVFLILMAMLFIYLYPLWTGVFINKNLLESYFWFKTWK